jgi:hypothetical protein
VLYQVSIGPGGQVASNDLLVDRAGVRAVNKVRMGDDGRVGADGLAAGGR